VTAPGGWDLPEPTDEELRAVNADPDLVTPADPTVAGAAYGLTDYDNARRLALYEAPNMRYVNDSDTWYKWCETRWCRAQLGDRFTVAANVALRIRAEALNIDDDDARDRHLAWSQQSLSEQRLRSMITVASGIPEMRVNSEMLDACGHLLNLPNCTIDPRTLEQHPHRREDYLTQLCPTAYEPDAWSHRLTSFLEKFLPDEKERDYTLQVLAVSTLSWGNAGRKLVLLLGPTSTGKSTLMDLVHHTLGRDYVASVNASVFRGNLEDKPRPDLLRAIKTRLIIASEASDRWELHPDQIKRMTGGDPITARGMRSDVMSEEIASFVPIIVANTPPAIHGSDDALRRRLLALVMDAAVPEDGDDGRLRTELVTDPEAQRALLALLIHVYHECDGRVVLPIPPRFAEQTMELFAALDDVDEVLRLLKEEGSIYPAPDETTPSMCITTTILFNCYSYWIDQRGTHQMKRDKLGPKQFTQRLKSLGYEIHRSNGARVAGWFMGNTHTTNVARF
jgi:P4 family phage/plasmid primase-like protien